MTPLATRLRNVLSGTEQILECRNCGTTVDADGDRCPHCDSEEIATYTIPK